MYVDRSNLPGRSPQGGQNDGIFAKFSLEPVKMEFKSAEAGRPIFEDREHVTIYIAGDNRTEVFREASDDDKARFADAYAAFKRSEENHEAIAGTPLREWPPMTPALVRNFAVSNIYTVEQLASLSDNAIQAVGMGTREWKAKAQAYLDRAAEGAGSSALVAENEQLKNDLAAMKQQLAAVAQQVAESAAKAEAAPVAAPAITAEQIAALVAGEVAKATAAINTRPVNDKVAPATGKGAKAA